MQIYPTYELLRLAGRRVIWVICTSLLIISTYELHASKLSYADSVYYSLTKKERLSRLFILPIGDFDKKDELSIREDIISTHNLGGIIIESGEMDEIASWIRRFKKKEISQRPFISLKLDENLLPNIDGFEEILPFSQIEVISNDSIIFELGRFFGREINDLGIELVMIDSVLSHNPDAIEKYINGIRSAGSSVIYTSPLEKLFVHSDTEHLNIARPIYKSADLVQETFDSIETGWDMVILPRNVQLSNYILSRLYENKPPKKKILKQRAKRIIAYKQKIEIQEVNPQVRESDPYRMKALESLPKSIVVVKNDDKILPMKQLDKHTVASISNSSIIREYLDEFTRVAHYNFEYFDKNTEKSIQTINHFNTVVVYIDNLKTFDSNRLDYLRQIAEKSSVIILCQGDKSQLNAFLDFSTVIWTPSYDSTFKYLLPQALFGSYEISGILYSKDSANQIHLTGEYLEHLNRLSYKHFDRNEESIDKLNEIDLLVRDAIQTEIFPGCQVLMAKGGEVIYHKAFGYLTYDSLIQVEKSTVYDIASITKVAGTLPSIMFLDDWNKLSPDDSLGQYLDVYAQSDKSGLKLEDILIHQAGFKSYLPFWRNAEFDAEADDFRFKLPRRRRYKFKTKTIDWNDSIQSWIAASKFNKLSNEDGSYRYLYSDLGFMALKNLAENEMNQSLEFFLSQNLFEPLGMYSTGYLPLCKLPEDNIAPTEEDIHLRNELVWGKVHDRNAALVEGISGHAGMFSNARDLAKYMQMIIQGGTYGGRQYFNENTTSYYTTKPAHSLRRARGWDKPDRVAENVSKYASDDAFGHSGFTGTIVWADPKYELVYVFLSNRVYPDAQNNKLIQSNIRTRIHDIMYESFLDEEMIQN